MKVNTERWYVIDLRESTLRELGWNGPCVDKILIANKSSTRMACEDQDESGNIIARISFENRIETLGDSNMAAAHLMAAAPQLKEALEDLIAAHMDLLDDVIERPFNSDQCMVVQRAKAAIKAAIYHPATQNNPADGGMS